MNTILHIAAENFAGVPFDFMQMHKQMGDKSRLITLHSNPLGFNEDICLDFPISRSNSAKWWRYKKSLIKKDTTHSFYWKPSSFLESLYFSYQSYSRKSTIHQLIHDYHLDESSIIHYDAGLDFTRDSFFAKRWKQMGKKIVNCYYGSDLRSRGIIKEMDDLADLSITTEYDHLSMKNNIHYIFYPYNPVELPSISPEKDFSTIRIVHSPTNRIYKGTDLICKVIEKLKRSYAFEFYLLENMSRDEVLKIKSTCTISIDQVGGKHGGTGYGKAGIESLSMGIPVITNMTNEYKDWLPENPFHIANDASQLEQQLVMLLENPDLCKQSGELGKSWVSRYHGYESVHNQLNSLYKQYHII